jgi:hypothetical protein
LVFLVTIDSNVIFQCGLADRGTHPKRRNGVGGAKSDGDEAASDDGSWALDLVTPPQKSPPLKKTPANRDSLPPDVYVPIDADVSPETQEKFERAKSLDMHEIFDTSTSSYKLMSSVIYDFATHWARQVNSMIRGTLSG